MFQKPSKAWLLLSDHFHKGVHEDSPYTVEILEKKW